MSEWIGTHLLIDFHEVAPEPLRDGALVAAALADAALAGGMTPLGPPAVHVFEGGGLTGYLLLSESHISVHTYPERGYAALDVFCCGRADADAALGVLRDRLTPGRSRVTAVSRGEMARLDGLFRTS